MSEPVRPEVAAWGLAGKKGWIDFDRYGARQGLRDGAPASRSPAEVRPGA